MSAASLWPWLALAGTGALHGLNPISGWGLAACWRDTRRALMPIALGHAVAVGGVAVVVATGGSVGGWQLLCGLLLLLALTKRHATAGLALCSGLMASAYGSGMLLVPALVPMCLSASLAREITASGSLLLALAAVMVHLAAMLGVTAALASVGRRCISLLTARTKYNVKWLFPLELRLARARARNLTWRTTPPGCAVAVPSARHGPAPVWPPECR